MSLIDIENRILFEMNPEKSYNFLRAFKSSNIRKHSSIVVLFGSPELNYKFARDIENADIKNHESVVLNSKDLYLIYKFARDVEGASYDLLSKAIVESKNIMYNYLFLRDIKKSLSREHINVIMKSQDKEYLEKVKILIQSRRNITNKKVINYK